jgi:O-antigen/teichoic acid export membrane protein
LREVFSYGVFATVTQMLGTVWREADRLLLGTLVSTSAVAYLTVPKNLAFRGMGALTNAGGVLFPRFSGTDDPQVQRRLFLDATWSLLVATILLFVPLAVLMPDLLRLWIDAEFARESAGIGQVIAASCIVRGAFVPYHQLFKGIGKPQYLTVFYLGSGLTNLALNVALIPALGLAGAGYAYAVTVVWGLTATAFAWRRVLGSRSWGPLLRAVVLPVSLGLAALLLSLVLRPLAGGVGWPGLLVLGAAVLAGTAIPVIGVEWILGGRGSHAGALLSAAGRLVGFLPWPRVVSSSTGERR